MKKRVLWATVAAALVAATVASGPGYRKTVRSGADPTLTKIAPGGSYDDGDVRIWINAPVLVDMGHTMGPGQEGVSSLNVDIENKSSIGLCRRPLWEHRATLIDKSDHEYGTVVFSSVPPRTELEGGCHVFVTLMFKHIDPDSKTVKIRVPYKDVLLEFAGVTRRRAEDVTPPVKTNDSKGGPAVKAE